VVIQGYRLLKEHSLSTEELYGIEAANLEIEKVPIQVGPVAKVKIKREKD
jgi:KUP system potassium uptake protein